MYVENMKNKTDIYLLNRFPKARSLELNTKRYFRYFLSDPHLRNSVT